MSDSTLRDAERHWHETRSLQTQVRYLKELMRAGGLSQERVELAAYCGHPAARDCLDLPIDLDPPHDGRTLARDLCTWGFEPLLRGAISAAMAQMARVRDRAPEFSLAANALESITDWFDHPSQELLDRVRAAERQISGLRDRALAAEDFEGAALARFAAIIMQSVLAFLASPQPPAESLVEDVAWHLDRSLPTCLRDISIWALGPGADHA